MNIFSSYFISFFILFFLHTQQQTFDIDTARTGQITSASLTNGYTVVFALTSSPSGLYGQIMKNDGSLYGSEVTLSTSIAGLCQAVPLKDGGFVIVYPNSLYMGTFAIYENDFTIRVNSTQFYISALQSNTLLAVSLQSGGFGIVYRTTTGNFLWSSYSKTGVLGKQNIQLFVPDIINSISETCSLQMLNNNIFLVVRYSLASPASAFLKGVIFNENGTLIKSSFIIDPSCPTPTTVACNNRYPDITTTQTECG